MAPFRAMCGCWAVRTDGLDGGTIGGLSGFVGCGLVALRAVFGRFPGWPVLGAFSSRVVSSLWGLMGGCIG